MADVGLANGSTTDRFRPAAQLLMEKIACRFEAVDVAIIMVGGIAALAPVVPLGSVKVVDTLAVRVVDLGRRSK